MFPQSVLAALDAVAKTLTSTGVIVMCGFPASGKSTAAAWIASQVGASVLDKDRYAPRLEQDVMRRLTGDPHDRDSDLYRSVISPGIYDGLIRTGLGIAGRHRVVLDAPFLSVIRQAAVAGRSLAHHMRAVAHAPDSLVVQAIWMDSPTSRIRERMIARGAAVQAVALVRDHLGEPLPHLHDCMDLLVVRADELGHHLPGRPGPLHLRAEALSSAGNRRSKRRPWQCG
ncbi:AAA family ATPase [Nocardia sp. NPDC052566]|uniref:AAA family ATPase n=1 Tax=Nocardia sp. NPDC052566 TaxID=3364330 RepID=UPI0037C851CB